MSSAMKVSSPSARFATAASAPVLVALACSPAPSEPARPLPPPAPAPVVAPPAPEPQAEAASEPVEAPAACPEDMLLVEGEYCSDVKHRCLVEWYAPQNNKRVCEKFEESAECVGTKTPRRFCIDRYAWPNAKGERPEIMNNFHQVQVKCAAVQKRLCSESEWTFACEGPNMKPFPYGFTRDPRKCNGDHKWDNPSLAKMNQRDPAELARLWRGVPNGSQPECVSDFGVADLPGNTDEVVAAESPTAKHSSVQTGGPWYSGVRNQCRPKIYTHGEETYGYFLSFRCCAEADGAENERRTKKQIRDGVTWDRIEKIAQFTVEEMQAVLEKKKRGECTCGARDVLCKTMCGTTMGPGAVDGSDATRVLHPARERARP
jgi:formylglycine-generating enzyme